MELYYESGAIVMERPRDLMGKETRRAEGGKSAFGKIKWIPEYN